jgi:alkanesulfonate monooxygenase SsuD/methylene tetrahydromethanopterin reductase-like flavin-dependent oxidoreductase (luciferase family)
LTPSRFPIRIGAQIWPQGGSWDQIRDAAVAADRAGLDFISTWDHLYAIFGDPHQPSFEGWTTLAVWAGITDRAALGLVVGANTFRDPGVVAKTAVTIDHASHGRCWLGLGSAWFEREHRAFGIEFGSGVGERLDWLDESAGALRRLLAGGSVTSPEDGRYRLREAVVRPFPYRGRGKLPIMIGGAGEKRTLRTVARHADIWNSWGSVEMLRRKLDVLAAHCADADRDIAEIEFSSGAYCVIRDDPAEARRVLTATLAASGRVHEPTPETDLVGPPERIAELWRPVVELGFTHLIVDLPAPYDRETIERLHEVRDLLTGAGPMG